MFKATFKKLAPKNKFVKNAGLIIGGTSFAQLILVLAAPVLTRIYAPEYFGVLAVFISLYSIFVIFSMLRFDIAIPIPEAEEDAINLVALSFLLLFIATTLIGILSFYFGEYLCIFLNVPVLSNYIWLLPFGLLAGGSYLILNQWNVRQKNFGRIGATKIKQAIATLIIQFSAFSFGAISLIFGHIAGQSIGVTSLSKPNLSKCSWKGIAKVAIRYNRFPKFSTPAGVFRVSADELPLLTLAPFFGPAAAGMYALTNRVLALPATVMGTAVGQVFYADAAESLRKGTFAQLVRNFHSKLAFIGMPPLILLLLIGPNLFELIFGLEWRQAGDFARWLSVWVYFVFVSSPLTTITAVMEKQKQGMIFHLSLFLVRSAALYIGVSSSNLMNTIIILAVVNTLWRFGFLIWLYLLPGNNIISFIEDTLKALIYSLIVFIPLILVIVTSPANWVYGFGISSLLNIIYYWKLMKEAY